VRDPAAAAQGGAGARSGEEPARPRGRGETRWVATVKAPSSCRVSFLAASVHLALAPAARGDSFGNFHQQIKNVMRTAAAAAAALGSMYPWNFLIRCSMVEKT